MTWKDVRPGATVYHTLMVHWGKGTVVGVTILPLLAQMFEKGQAKRVSVEWEHREPTPYLRLRVLRKTPNRKKIRQMVEFYRNRGTAARDGGDCLILPEKRGQDTTKGGDANCTQTR